MNSSLTFLKIYHGFIDDILLDLFTFTSISLSLSISICFLYSLYVSSSVQLHTSLSRDLSLTFVSMHLDLSSILNILSFEFAILFTFGSLSNFSSLLSSYHFVSLVFDHVYLLNLFTSASPIQTSPKLSKAVKC